MNRNKQQYLISYWKS